MDWEPRVGMRVVFVGYPERPVTAVGGKVIPSINYMEVGDICTIRKMSIRKHYAGGRWNGPSFYVGFDHPQYGRVWHHHTGFRPLDTRKTDISIFTAMLTKAPTPEKEPA